MTRVAGQANVVAVVIFPKSEPATVSSVSCAVISTAMYLDTATLR